MILPRLDFDRQSGLGPVLGGVQQHFAFRTKGHQQSVSSRAGLGQPGSIQFGDRRVRGNITVENGLRKSRLIGFVMSVTAVANDINDGIRAKFLPILQSDFGSQDNGIGIVPVGVKNGRFGEFSDFGTMMTGTGFIRIRGEADLIITYEVNGAADRVTLQTCEI